MDVILLNLIESTEGNIITVKEIGQALLEEKMNNPQNIETLKQQLKEFGYKIQIKR